MAAIQIRSQALRRRHSALQAGALGAFALMTDEPDNLEATPQLGHKGRWRQGDVRRAIAAAEQAGLGSYRVEIAPDGTIAIIVGEPSDTAGDP